jgi:exonuclease SbcC
VVEALRAVCENARGSHFMVRHGQKEAVVTIETDDGHVISWQRRAKTSSYTIDGVRNDRPEADFLERVHRLLKLPKVKASESGDEFDVHFGEQKSPIFLLNETGARSATFFASSSDAERLLQMQRIHRAKVVEDKKEEQKRAAKMAALDARLAAFSPLDEIEPRLAQVQVQFEALKLADANAARLEALCTRLNQAQRRVARHQAQREAAEGLMPPPVLRDEVAAERLIHRYDGARKRLDRATKQIGAMAAITPPPLLADTVAMGLLCNRRRILEKRVERLSAINAHLSALAPPPLWADPSALAQRIAGLRRTQTARDRAAARAARLADVVEPPALRELGPTADLLLRLRTVHGAAMRNEQLLKTALNQLAQTQASIEAWAKENPICPVCNGTVDPARLLATAGEHTHG